MKSLCQRSLRSPQFKSLLQGPLTSARVWAWGVSVPSSGCWYRLSRRRDKNRTFLRVSDIIALYSNYISSLIGPGKAPVILKPSLSLCRSLVAVTEKGTVLLCVFAPPSSQTHKNTCIISTRTQREPWWHQFHFTSRPKRSCCLCCCC